MMASLNLGMIAGAINVGKPLSNTSKDFLKYTIVHELAHAWDFASNGTASLDMMRATGSWYFCWWYIPGGKTTDYGDTNHAEDWAEAVASYVYSPGNIGTERIAYVKYRMQLQQP